MFRFVIRDVLWLMVVVVILAAWWAEHRAQEHRFNRLRNSLEIDFSRGPIVGEAEFRRLRDEAREKARKEFPLTGSQVTLPPNPN
jgi:hypothetical protein